MSTSDPKLVALEKSLASLVPVPGRIERDQLLFRAGQASVRSRIFWPASTALLSVLALALGTVLALGPALIPRDRLVYVLVTPPADSNSSRVHLETDIASSDRPVTRDFDNLWASSAEYLRQRNQVIRWGMDALPPSPAMASSTQTPTIESMLGLPERRMNRTELFPLKF